MIRDIGEAADVSAQSLVWEVPKRGFYSHFPRRTPVGAAQRTSCNNERSALFAKY